MRALLTGGAGFIGSHLAKALISEGFHVDVVDNLSTGSKANISSLQGNARFRFFQGQAEDPALMEPLIQACDVVYHLAASVGVKNIMLNCVESIENNLFSTALVLRLGDKHKKRIFIFSTSEVYGKTQKFPFAEEDDIVLGPVSKLRWSYAASKLVDDYLARSYFCQNNTAVTMVRLFNTIGVGQVGHYGMVVPRFFQQARAHQPLTVYGDGNQTRCFTDVRDVCEALRLLIPVNASHGELVNIGNDGEISIRNLAEKIKAVVGSSSPLEFVNYEKVYGQHFEDMDRRVPSHQKLQSLTGFSFRYNLSDTLRWIEADYRESFKTPQDLRSQPLEL